MIFTDIIRLSVVQYKETRPEFHSMAGRSVDC